MAEGLLRGRRGQGSNEELVPLVWGSICTDLPFYSE